MSTKTNKDLYTPRCRFNDGVVCNEQHCDKCGWNPEVAQARRLEYEKKLKGGKTNG